MGAGTPTSGSLARHEAHICGPSEQAMPQRVLSVVHYDDSDSGDGGALNVPRRVDSAQRPNRSHRDPKQFSDTIKARIHARTSDRIRDLDVICEDGRIILRGRCATFYTKQLAQHAAMGVVEDETLVNEISVGVSR